MRISTSVFFAALTVSTSTFAADLSVRPAPYAAAAMTSSYDWTGFYAGLQAGGVWNSSHWGDFAGGPAFNTNATSALIGLQLGYNYQWNNFVLGVEGEFSGFNATGKSQCSNVVGSECRTRQTWLGAARLRAGYSIDRLLFYGTGGIAFTDYRFDQTTALAQSWSGGSRTGWTVGLGAEYAFADHWSAGLEWKHYDFGTKTGTGGAAPTAIGFREISDVGVLKVNYKF